MENEQKQYELICILSPNLEEADLDGFKKDIEKMLADNNGQLIHALEPQKRELAYPIKKQDQGIYIVCHIALAPENTNTFLKELKNSKHILRHLINVLEIHQGEKTDATRRPRIKKEIKEYTDKPSFVKTATNKDEKMNLEEIDKKLDELVGL